MIVRARRLFFKTLDDHAAGKLPFGLDQGIDYRAIRALAIRFPRDTDWRQLDLKNPPGYEFRLSDAS